jgi:hypothetical protein
VSEREGERQRGERAADHLTGRRRSASFRLPSL